MFGKMQDLLQEILQKLGIRDAHLRKLGVEEMLKDQGVRVESVEEFDADNTPTNMMERKGN